MRLLVSVSNLDEAAAAADAGVDFIDLKDPAAGALGALPTALASAIVRTLGRRDGRLFSATTGDWPSAQAAQIIACVDAVASTGVDYVKVGIDGAAGSRTLLDALARCPARIVPVLLADRGIDHGLVAHALALQRFPALMVDSADKGVGSLLQRLAPAALAGFVARVRATSGSPVLAGIAGALRLDELPQLRELAPDFAGFRSAVCVAGRASALDPLRLRMLRDAFDREPAKCP